MVTIMKRDKVGAGLSSAAEIQASIQWRCMAIKSRNNSNYLPLYACCFRDRYSSHTSDATKRSKALSAKRPSECVWLKRYNW